MPQQQLGHAAIKFGHVISLIKRKMLGGGLWSPAFAIPEFELRIFFLAK